MSYTFALMDVSPATYAEIRAKLVEAQYDHAFHKDEGRDVLDLQGIALREQSADPAATYRAFVAMRTALVEADVCLACGDHTPGRTCQCENDE
jgi:hypothetical protein